MSDICHRSANGKRMALALRSHCGRIAIALRHRIAIALRHRIMTDRIRTFDSDSIMRMQEQLWMACVSPPSTVDVAYDKNGDSDSIMRFSLVLIAIS